MVKTSAMKKKKREMSALFNCINKSKCMFTLLTDTCKKLIITFVANEASFTATSPLLL